MHAKLIFSLVLAGLAVVFIIQNVAMVEIQFLFWSVQMSRSIFMFLLLATGIIVGWVLNSYVKYRKNK